MSKFKSTKKKTLENIPNNQQIVVQFSNGKKNKSIKKLKDFINISSKTGSLFNEPKSIKLKKQNKKDIFGSSLHSSKLFSEKKYVHEQQNKNNSQKERIINEICIPKIDKDRENYDEEIEKCYQIELNKKLNNIVFKKEKASDHPLAKNKINSKNKEKSKTIDIDHINFNYCNTENESHDPVFSPFFLRDQKKNKLLNWPGIPDTEPSLKYDPAFYDKLDNYFSGKTGDCNYNVPDRNKINQSTCSTKKSDSIRLYRYQKLVSDYLSPETPYRGLLVYHGLGSGKTILSISVLSNFIKRDPDRSIIVITPPKLRGNFISELNLFSPIELFGETIGQKIEFELHKKFKKDDIKNPLYQKKKKELFRKYWNSRIYVASYEELANRLERRYLNGRPSGSTQWNEGIQDNCLQKKDPKKRTIGVCRGTTLGVGGKGKCSNLPEKLCAAKPKSFKDSDEFPSLENCLIIIDEAHKLINPEKDDIRFAPIILRGIQRANDIKVLLLSATPIDKEPFEIGILLNLLKNKNSKYRFPQSLNKDGTINLEQTKKDFEKKFLTLKDGDLVPKNLDEFRKNCTGLVSYYNTELDYTKFARKIYEPNQNVVMHKDLLKKYYLARKKEINNLNKKNLHLSCESLNSCDLTRQLSDYIFNTKLKIKKTIKNMPENSPKLNLLLNNIQKNIKIGKQFVYSYWDNSGVLALSYLLLDNGWHEYTADELADNYIKNAGTKRNGHKDVKEKGWKPDFKKKIPNRKSFIVLGKGAVGHPVDTIWRETLLKIIFNRNENKKGKEINLIIVNKKYSEGISLKHMRTVHIMEPPESIALKNQIIGRSVRDCSHVGLPFKDWNVRVFTYFSDIPTIGTISDNLLDEKTQETVSKEDLDKFINHIKSKENFKIPFRTQNGSLLNVNKAKKCLDEFDQCIHEIKKIESKNPAQFKKLMRLCDNKKNLCIVNAKIRPKGESSNAIELPEIKYSLNGGNNNFGNIIGGDKRFPKPRGRTPKNKVWDYQIGKWVAIDKIEIEKPKEKNTRKNVKKKPNVKKTKKNIKNKKQKSIKEEKIIPIQNNNICEFQNSKNLRSKCNTIEFCDITNDKNTEFCEEIGTDRSLDILSQKRNFVTDQFLKIIKESAIDCVVFKNANESYLKCYRPKLPAKYKETNDINNKKKNTINIKIPSSILNMKPKRENVNCLEYQKDKCKSMDDCYYTEPNAILGLAGTDTGCRFINPGKINCNNFDLDQKKCNKYNFYCNYQPGDLINQSKCNFKFNQNLRILKNAIMFGLNGNPPNYSQLDDNNWVYILGNVTQNLINQEMINLNDKILFIKTNDDMILIMDRIIYMFYYYESSRKYALQILETIQYFKQNYPSIWDSYLQNKLATIIKTLKIQTEKNPPQYFTGQINIDGGPNLSISTIKKLISSNRLHFLIKIFIDDFEYYIDTNDSVFKKQKPEIDLNILEKDKIFITKFKYQNINIQMEFLLVGNKIDKVNMIVSTKDIDINNLFKNIVLKETESSDDVSSELIVLEKKS